jgi:hypothetical protein
MRYLIVLVALISFTGTAVAENGIPKIQPFSKAAERKYQPAKQPKKQLTKAEVRKTLERNIVKSGKLSNLVIPVEEFNKRLSEAGIIPRQFTDNPTNTLYIFTDPDCPLSSKAVRQVEAQKYLYEANGVNVHWLPIVQSGDPKLYQQSLSLFTGDPNYQDTTPNQMRALLRQNTELYATSFDKVATPLVFWQTEDGGIEILLGYPKSQNNNSFLLNVSQRKGFLEWLVTLANK